MIKWKLYLFVGLLGVIVTLGGRLAWNHYQELKDENKRLNTQIEVIEINVDLLETLLEDEKKTREAAQEALNALLEDVPDEVFQTTLPPEIQSVIDGFHSRIRNNP